MSERNKDVVRRYFEYASAGRIDDYLDLLHPDFMLIGKGMPASAINHRSNKTDLGRTARNYEGRFQQRMQFEVENLIAEGDFVSAQLRSRATLSDGTPYANQYCFCARFQDGLIIAMDEYCCTFTAVETLRKRGVKVAE